MTDGAHAFVAVAQSGELAEGQKRCVDVGGVKVALVRVEGRVHAIADTCPHRGASLSEGDLDGHTLYCPLHAWCFDVRSGWAFFPESAAVAAFPVREADGVISVSPAGKDPRMTTWRPPSDVDR